MIFFLILGCVTNAVFGYSLDDDRDIQLLVHDLEDQFREMSHSSYDVLNKTSDLSRHGRSVACHCGPGTMSCRKLSDLNFCSCVNNKYVIGGDCKDCKCQNAVCDLRDGSCQCLKHHAEKDGECVPCNCGGTKNTCGFSDGFKVCDCDGRFAVDSTCEECICGDNEVCVMHTKSLHCFCEPNLVHHDLDCINCTCAEGENVCILTETQKECKCIKGYTRLNEVCTECDCPQSFHCSFVEGNPVCSCGRGYLKYEEENICKECFCGEGHPCNFSAEGEKTCMCHSPFVDVNGTCEKCACSENEICEVQNGVVVCKCKDNYLYSEKQKTCLECFCGEGHDCTLVDGKKLCICGPKFFMKDGTCEECDCGDEHSCEFENGKKVCRCLEDYADNNGTCEECFCGEGSDCLFEGGQKVCICKEGFVEKNGKCGKLCHKKTCLQGVCEGYGPSSFCRCNKGFTGPRCEKQSAAVSVDVTLVISIVTVASLLVIIIVARCAFMRIKRRSKAYGESEVDDKPRVPLHSNSEILPSDETMI